MKILFDCRYTRLERHDGISRFTAGLVTALAKLTPVTMVISDERQLTMLPDLPWVLTTPPTSLAEPLVGRKLNRFTPDVVYSPMQTIGPFGRRFGLVTTVHDLIYYENRTPPRDLAWYVRLLWRLYHLSWRPQRSLLKRADAHATVSETTRALMRAHRLTPHPITIVPNAVDHSLAAEESSTATSHSAPLPKVLVYMGSFMPYKNVELLARALHLLPGYTLRLLSSASDERVAALSALAPEGSLVFDQGVSDEEYSRILRASTALVTASLNEGFGIPLVEAMAAGTPIVVSDIPIFREIGADVAEYFDPTDPESFAAAVHALEDRTEWEHRSESGRHRAAEFSWERSAEALLGALTRVYEERTAKRTRAMRPS